MMDEKDHKTNGLDDMSSAIDKMKIGSNIAAKVVGLEGVNGNADSAASPPPDIIVDTKSVEFVAALEKLREECWNNLGTQMKPEEACKKAATAKSTMNDPRTKTLWNSFANQCNTTKPQYNTWEEREKGEWVEQGGDVWDWAKEQKVDGEEAGCLLGSREKECVDTFMYGAMESLSKIAPGNCADFYGSPVLCQICCPVRFFDISFSIHYSAHKYVWGNH